MDPTRAGQAWTSRADVVKPYSPPFVTETDEAPPWIDCTWCAALMAANKASLGRYPATRSEREALRKASGDHTGGSNLDDVTAGILNRYGWTLSGIRPTLAGLLARLAAGDGAIACGHYSALPAHFTRWDPAFAHKPNTNHAAYAQGHDRGGNYHLGAAGIPTEVFWMDPLGRSPAGTPAADRYRGEWMPVAVFAAFLAGLASGGRQYVALVRQGSV